MPRVQNPKCSESLRNAKKTKSERNRANVYEKDAHSHTPIRLQISGIWVLGVYFKTNIYKNHDHLVCRN